MGRSNYAQIHASPLPLTVHALPAFSPSNPLSLLHLVSTYIHQLSTLSATSSHDSNYVAGYYSPDSNSVSVTVPAAIRLLWEKGFFGKGSLSRSEPTWLDGEKKRLGMRGVQRSEDVRQKRREERRAMKLERARKEREEIEARLRKEGKLVDADTTLLAGSNPQELTKEDDKQRPSPENANETAEMQESNVDAPQEVQQAAKHDIHLQNKEHLQLAPEEAFFLSFGLGILQIHHLYSHPTRPLSPTEQLSLFRRHAHFPPCPASDLRPDDPFLLSYVVYHHYRSRGWVVRPGVKFAVDWLLYCRGPAFAHAEFAVVILPAYTHAYWREPAQVQDTQRRERRDWWWYHCLQRVQAQVKKGLVVCWVDVPPPADAERAVSGTASMPSAKHNDIAEMLKLYKVRDMCMKRWVPNRNRD